MIKRKTEHGKHAKNWAVSGLPQLAFLGGWTGLFPQEELVLAAAEAAGATH